MQKYWRQLLKMIEVLLIPFLSCLEEEGASPVSLRSSAPRPCTMLPPPDMRCAAGGQAGPFLHRHPHRVAGSGIGLQRFGIVLFQSAWGFVAVPSSASCRPGVAPASRPLPPAPGWRRPPSTMQCSTASSRTASRCCCSRDWTWPSPRRERGGRQRPALLGRARGTRGRGVAGQEHKAADA